LQQFCFGVFAPFLASCREVGEGTGCEVAVGLPRSLDPLPGVAAPLHSLADIGVTAV
jgi:hypothetical protein